MAMIRPETEMKDSGVQWIGDIPKEWSVGKVKHEFYATKTIVGDKVNDYERLALTLNGVIKRSKDAGDGLQPEKFDGYQILKEHELVFKLIDLANVSTSRVGLSPYTGIVSPAYIVLHHRKDMNPRYGEYYFLSMWMNEVFNHIGGDGVRSALNVKDLLNIPYLKVSPDEQQAIADYLDQTCSKIDEIIAEAKASIDEYKELKQSAIFEAVTKGLDKNIEFIDSGDEWLGKYPKSYNIGQLSMLSNIVRGGSPRPAGDPRYYGGNISFMRIADITKDENIYVNSCENTITEEGLIRTRIIPPNTLLLTNSGATLGVPKINTFETAFNDGIAAFLDLDERLNIVYVYFFLKARTSYFLECASMGMGQPNLNIDIIGRTKIVFPTLVEQQKVVSYLEDRCGKLNSLISEKESLINDLEAYKKSLIYEVVTGKRRVV
jgi:type I restriction enzyme S subunit